jgi:hypothetical protein
MRTIFCILILGSAMHLMNTIPNGWAVPPARASHLPIGKWNIEFSNGVVEDCSINQDGTASVAEPGRRSRGNAVGKDGLSVVLFEDGRVERWRPVGKRMVVEHWGHLSDMANGTPVLGIGERVE